MNELVNKVAIVTGGGSGIGRAVALLYAAEGAKVVVADLDEKGGNETVTQVTEKGGEAFFIAANSAVAEDNRKIVAQTIERFGALHIACNNAGIGGPIQTVADYPLDGWEKVIGINLSGVFYAMHYQIPAMLAAGGGSIVNMASILGQAGTRGSAAYVAAKHGVVGLTKAAALEYALQNVRINCVGPGYIKTPLLNMLDKEQLNMLVKLHPVGRLGLPEEVAELVLWLSSARSSFVNGSYYPVDGGYLAQ